MTAFEAWIVEQVKIAMRDVRGQPEWTDLIDAARDGETESRPNNQKWVDLEQRIAILLVQARALECRHLAGELAIKNGNNPVALTLARACWDRSHKLEAIGMLLAREWPIPDVRVEPRDRLCRCGHKNMQHQPNCEECGCQGFEQEPAAVIEMPKAAERTDGPDSEDD